MIDVEPLIRRDLNKVVELPADLRADWADVRRRVDAQQVIREGTQAPLDGFVRRLRRRPLLAVVIALVIALIPVSALAVVKSDPWWFLRFNNAGLPHPVRGTSVVVVKTGSWNGQSWILSAFRSSAGGICWQLTGAVNGKPSPSGGGGVSACAQLVGTAGPPTRQRPLTITYVHSFNPPNTRKLSGSGLPSYIVGPVIGSASQVVIRLGNGAVIRTPTFKAPHALRTPLRFYATPLPEPTQTQASHPSCKRQALQLERFSPTQLTGIDSKGHVVARLLGLGKAEHAAAVARCRPPSTQIAPANAPPAATKSIRPVLQIVGAYRASATLAVGKTVLLPTGHLLPGGRIKQTQQQSRCWKVVFSDGHRQGTCSSQTKRHNPPGFLDYLEIEHVGRAVFVIAHAAARTGPPVTKISLELAPGKSITARPIAGVAVFAVPRADLHTKGGRHQVTGYDDRGQILGQQHVYYRSCPNSTASGGGGC